ncbi:MAG: hypothetical protein AAFP26_12660, partial [Planctomycetota bacterium]
LDYLTDFQPEPIAASPLDRNLLRWQADPLDESDLPARPSDSNKERDGRFYDQNARDRWAYASTYQVVPAAWNNNRSPSWAPIEDTSNLFLGGDTIPLPNRRFSEVSFPSGKVHMFEEFDRATNSDGIWYGYPDAQCNLMFFDSSVRSISTSESNLGWDPTNPNDEFKQRYTPIDTFPEWGKYDPGSTWEPRYRWTRQGLAGIDFGGKDIGRPDNLDP